MITANELRVKRGKYDICYSLQRGGSVISVIWIHAVAEPATKPYTVMYKGALISS